MDRPFVQDCEIDLESGGSSTSEEEERYSVNNINGNGNHPNKFFGRVWSEQSRIGDCNSPEVKVENEESMNRKKSCGKGENFEGEMVKEKRKHSSSKKPPKPPRGPSLDAADLKLIKEISQLAMLKRARVERIKALKKMKAAKPSSINSSLYATVITILFCLVIVFQGTCSKSSSHVSFEGSPEMSVANNGGQISVQHYKNLPYANTEGPGSLPPNFIEEIARSSTQEERNRLVG